MNKVFRLKACLSRKMKSDAEVLVQDKKTQPLKETDEATLLLIPSDLLLNWRHIFT